MSKSPKDPKDKCRIAEIMQHSCDIEQDKDGKNVIRCYPLPRFFRICPGRGSVELTRFVDVDTVTGDVCLPPGDSQPQGKQWRDVFRHPLESVKPEEPVP